ncbi:hypothetical protein B5X24_HaOG202497 [Helicoverpa armigera]|uniref:Uncharacterized protein n=1 Tax=Helicoverpa armigera TaxID=29058 RepID=A0A2W1BZT8_HELAM|nr:hypothetical protein B5X24_HaOG202497 [Helicoverpa armigera]
MSVEHNIELSCVELDKHVLVCVYRPPQHQNLCVFDSVMEDVLKKVSSSSKGNYALSGPGPERFKEKTQLPVSFPRRETKYL